MTMYILISSTHILSLIFKYIHCFRSKVYKIVLAHDLKLDKQITANITTMQIVQFAVASVTHHINLCIDSLTNNITYKHSKCFEINL